MMFWADFSRDDYNGAPMTNLVEIIDYVRPTALLGLSTITVSADISPKISRNVVVKNSSHVPPSLRYYRARLLRRSFRPWRLSIRAQLFFHSQTLFASQSVPSPKPWNIQMAGSSLRPVRRSPHSHSRTPPFTLGKEIICTFSLVCDVLLVLIDQAHPL